MDMSDFETFWKLYPLKIKKAGARLAFQRAIPKVELDELLTGVKRYVAYLSANTWLSPAHAQTWLNQERWTDELPSPQSDTSWRVSAAVEQTLRRRMQ